MHSSNSTLPAVPLFLSLLSPDDFSHCPGCLPMTLVIGPVVSQDFVPVVSQDFVPVVSQDFVPVVSQDFVPVVSQDDG